MKIPRWFGFAVNVVSNLGAIVYAVKTHDYMGALALIVGTNVGKNLPIYTPAVPSK